MKHHMSRDKYGYTTVYNLKCNSSAIPIHKLPLVSKEDFCYCYDGVV